MSLYCPDRHVSYDGGTPDRDGVGGGVTARLRLAAALARRGHSVEVVCNCRRTASFDGAVFRPLDSVTRIDADILIMHTTGGALDLRPALALDLRASRRIVLADGVEAPLGLHDVQMDHLYACSNFIALLGRQQWGVPVEKIVVSHHGVCRRYFQPRWWDIAARNPHAIAYATHPSKGLAPAIEVLRRLRQIDSRFELHVFGGYQLWGGREVAVEGPGVVYHGLLGQRMLARRLTRLGFALYLQSREEPFGIAVVEALAAGCITVASAVGAHGEIIDDRVTGFLVPGASSDDAVIADAAAIIAAVSRNAPLTDRMRSQAQAVPLDWATVARAWEESWQPSSAMPLLDAPPCSRCSAQRIVRADGYHCSGCGYYSRTAD